MTDQPINKKALCKQALATYKELLRLTAMAQVKMLEFLMHPDCPDELALETLHNRRKAVAQMRQARGTLAEKLREAGLHSEARDLSETRI